MSLERTSGTAQCRKCTKVGDVDAEPSGPDESVPSRPSTTGVERVAGLVININYIPQVADGGGVNTVTNGSGTAIGTQVANDGSAVGGSGSQALCVNGEHSSATGWGSSKGSAVGANRPPDRWWSRLRKRGLLVALATNVAAVVATLQWLGWTPWS